MTDKPTCALSDQELIEKCEKYIKMIDVSGSVTEIIFSELIKRFKEQEEEIKKLIKFDER